jgi:hypothetical protein
MSGRGRGGGGHATAGGVDFQACVAVGLTAGMLAETAYTPPWGWPEEATIEAVRSETGEVVDDIYVRTSLNARAYVQAKNSIDLGEPAGSEFGKTIKQFADQYLACRDGDDGRAPLDLRHDRLVLAVGSAASGTIRTRLSAVLDRIRDWPADQPLLEAASNEQEKTALEKTVAHLIRAFRERDGAHADEAELRRVLSLMVVSVHEFGDDGFSQREALQLLRASVVADPARAGNAWDALYKAAAADTAGQSGTDRAGAQQLLRNRSIPVLAPRSYREDVADLEAHTERTLVALRDLADIALHDRRAKIDREAPRELARLTEQASCLVVGDPGGGKSATLYELARILQSAGADVVALAADRLVGGSLGALRVELGLDHDIGEILRAWPTERGVLLIDALDAARGDRTQQALLDVIEVVRLDAPEWTVVASIRRFDLRHNQRLRQLFPVEALADDRCVDAEFIGLSHFRVAELSNGELAQLSELVPNVHAFLQNATVEMHGLMRTPFNVRLLAQLLDADIDPGELHPITKQLELLDRYWQLRVLEPVDRADMREALLRRVCELIVESRSMHVQRADIQASDGALLPTLPEVLSLQLLVESPLADGAVDRDIVAFAHHVLFDYAAARLLLRRRTSDVADALVRDRQMSVLIRPSLDLHARWLWARRADHAEFWELVFAIAERPDIPQIATIVGTGVAAEMTGTLDDLAPLATALRVGDAEVRSRAELVLSQVLASADTLGVPFVGAGAGPWASLAAGLDDA